MRKTYRYRIYPNSTQKSKLLAILRVACNLYNEAKEHRDFVYATSGKSQTYADQSAYFKNSMPEYVLLTAQVLQNVLRRVDRTYQAFFRRVKRGEKPGFPRFRSVYRYDSFTYPQATTGFKLGDRLYLSGVGHIKIRLHRAIEGKVKTLTIRRLCGQWYACFSCEVEPQPLPLTGNSVGIDVGVRSLVAFSTGETVDNPRHMKASEVKLKRWQQALSRKKRGSQRRIKTRGHLAKAHRRVRNQREDFLHKLSRRIVNENDTIVVEDLKVARMVESGERWLSKAIGEAAWRSLFDKIAYKAAEAGRRVIAVDPKHTSQVCLCGNRVEKTLADRTHSCPYCGAVEDRDVMSAKVLLKLSVERALETFLEAPS